MCKRVVCVLSSLLNEWGIRSVWISQVIYVSGCPVFHLCDFAAGFNSTRLNWLYSATFLIDQRKWSLRLNVKFHLYLLPGPPDAPIVVRRAGVLKLNPFFRLFDFTLPIQFCKIRSVGLFSFSFFFINRRQRVVHTCGLNFWSLTSWCWSRTRSHRMPLFAHCCRGEESHFRMG